MRATKKRHAQLASRTPLAIGIVAVIGLLLNRFAPLPFLPEPINLFVGVALLIISSYITWRSIIVRADLYHPKTDMTCYLFFYDIYRFSRHPGYVGLIGMLLGLAVIANSLLFVLGIIVLIILLSLFVIPREEKVLESLCKESYREYKQKVRMWL